MRTITILIRVLCVLHSYLIASDEVTYPVSEFLVAYVKGEEGMPPIEDVQSVIIEWVDRQKKIGDTPEYHVDDLRDLLQTISSYINDLGYKGILVGPHNKDINARSGIDYREAGNTELRLGVLATEVGELSVKDENGDKTEELKPYQKYMLKDSPLLVGSKLKMGELNEYVKRWSRFGSRQVNARLDKMGKVGEAELSYTLREGKPWSGYAQYSNTGSKSTGEWVSRAGGSYNQLFGYDDRMTLDFSSADFGKTKSVYGSYEQTLIFPGILRSRVYGSLSEYNGASTSTVTVNFDGTSNSAGAELIWNPLWYKNFALDVKGGLRYETVESNSETLSQFGESDLLIPYLGLSVERSGDTLKTTYASVSLENNIMGINNQTMENLGRQIAEDKSWIIKGGLTHSFYLKPILFGEKFYTKEDWRKSTLAHEVMLNIQGQFVYGDERPIAQKQSSLGGFYSIRGYPTSVVSGDNSIYANLEYHFYLGRSLKPFSEYSDENRPKKLHHKFSQFPEKPGMIPDWDMVIRAFLDFGHVSINNKLDGEEDFDLASIGLGIEPRIYRNFSLRIDAGYPLIDLKRSGVTIDNAGAGDARIHLSGTLSF